MTELRKPYPGYTRPYAIATQGSNAREAHMVLILDRKSGVAPQRRGRWDHHLENGCSIALRQAMGTLSTRSDLPWRESKESPEMSTLPQ